MSNNDVADALGVTPSAVSHMVKGRRGISQQQEIILTELTGIPARYFTKELTGRDKIEIELLLGAETSDSEQELLKELATLRKNYSYVLNCLNEANASKNKLKDSVIKYINDYKN